MTVAGSAAFDDSITTGITEITKLAWTRGWARNEVRMLNSSCEWWTAWNRHNGVQRWLAQWASQLTPSIRSTATARTASRGRKVSVGTVNHGAMRPATWEKPKSTTMLSGTT